MNRALLAAGLIDRVQVTIFPVINSRSQSGKDRIFEDTADFDLELIESHTLDGHTQQLIYRPTPAHLSSATGRAGHPARWTPDRAAAHRSLGCAARIDLAGRTAGSIRPAGRRRSRCSTSAPPHGLDVPCGAAVGMVVVQLQGGQE
ncbi:hypothetical protein [Kribbella caucasensis]|uniref:hypothetical protein n=1 Tax=Kribbella caucasensis TaxID=2512215 RepID=UPI001EDD1549|nr:hypothetical protein [Kribbella sp. VKM Ac-2527]